MWKINSPLKKSIERKDKISSGIGLKQIDYQLKYVIYKN